MLLTSHDDLVVRPEIEPGEHDVAAVRRRPRQRDVLRLDTHECGESRAYVGSQLEVAVEIRLPHPALLEVGVQLLLHGLECRPGERAERTGVEVGDALEDREERARLCRRHPIETSTGAWSESTTPFWLRRSSGQVLSGEAVSPRTRTWSIPGPRADQP